MRPTCNIKLTFTLLFGEEPSCMSVALLTALNAIGINGILVDWTTGIKISDLKNVI